MVAGTSFCLIVSFLVCSCTAQTKISAELGQDAILPSKVPNNIDVNNIRAVEWSRPGLDPNYILLYRDGHLDPHHQHPSYQNRVDLQDKEMKDGDVSMILKNVTMEDNGRYVCRVSEKGKNEHISFTYLEVLPPGDKGGIIGDGGDKDGGDKDGGGMDGTIVGSVVGVIFLLAVASGGFLIYRRHTKKNPNLPVPPVEPPDIPMPTVHESTGKPQLLYL